MRDVPRQARRSSAQVKSAIERANDRAVNPRPSDRASNRARFHCPSLTLLTPNSTPRPSSKSKTIMTEPRIEVCPTLVIWTIEVVAFENSTEQIDVGSSACSTKSRFEICIRTRKILSCVFGHPKFPKVDLRTELAMILLNQLELNHPGRFDDHHNH